MCYLDSEQRFRYCAPSYQKLVGHPAAKLLGRHIREVVGQAAYGKLQHRLAEALSGERTSFEVRLPLSRDKAGERQATYVPDVGPGGDVKGFFVHVRDVTALKETEAALRVSEADYRDLVEHATLGIFRSTLAGEFLSVNRSLVEMLGYEIPSAAHGYQPARRIPRSGGPPLYH